MTVKIPTLTASGSADKDSLVTESSDPQPAKTMTIEAVVMRAVEALKNDLMDNELKKGGMGVIQIWIGRLGVGLGH